MQFKKIYIEITNSCNLKCSFCPSNMRKKEFLEFDKFKLLLEKIKPYTKYLYFHLMGEPLLHPLINEFIDYASQYFKINITTNGYYIKKIENNKNIRQLNISLQAFNNDSEDYLMNIIEVTNKLIKNGTIVNFRVWNNTETTTKLINKIEEYYKVSINGNTKIKDNLYVDYATIFNWPDINNNYYNEYGSCMALRTHIGILVDGSVVPCCLDYNGNLCLGNIYKDNLVDILQSPKAINLLYNFKNNKKVEEMCRHCDFYDRITKKKARDKNERQNNN